LEGAGIPIKYHKKRIDLRNPFRHYYKFMQKILATAPPLHSALTGADRHDHDLD
jgi:hypothetical protein